MRPSSKPRSSSRAADPDGNLALALTPEVAEPMAAAPAEAEADPRAARGGNPELQAPPHAEPDEPEPEVEPEAADEAEPEDEPIAAGRLRWVDATAEQQERARAELQERIAAHLQRARARVMLTDNTHTMLSIKRGHGVLTFRLHHMFVGAPASITRAVARYAEAQERESAALLHRYVDANEALIRRREDPRPVTLDTEGRWHNLQVLFDELNELYFDGGIKARITWGPRGKRRYARESIKLGSYTVEDELIRIHPVLDAKDVPRFFVAWIIYHEMLHEVHDMPVVDGRRVYHTPEFRRAEARFERYAEAVMWERANLHKLLER